MPVSGICKKKIKSLSSLQANTARLKRLKLIKIFKQKIVRRKWPNTANYFYLSSFTLLTLSTWTWTGSWPLITHNRSDFKFCFCLLRWKMAKICCFFLFEMIFSFKLTWNSWLSSDSRMESKSSVRFASFEVRFSFCALHNRPKSPVISSISYKSDSRTCCHFQVN